MNLFLHPYSPNKMFSTESFGKILLFTKLPRVTAPSLLPDNIDRRARHREQEFLILSSCRNSAARPQSTRSFSLSPPSLARRGRGGGRVVYQPQGFLSGAERTLRSAGPPVRAQQRAQVSARAATVTRQGATAERDFCSSNLRDEISAV